MSRKNHNHYGPAPVINNHIVNNHRKTNHLLHLILTILTGGIWAVVWVFLIVVRS